MTLHRKGSRKGGRGDRDNNSGLPKNMIYVATFLSICFVFIFHTHNLHKTSEFDPVSDARQLSLRNGTIDEDDVKIVMVGNMEDAKFISERPVKILRRIQQLEDKVFALEDKIRELENKPKKLHNTLEASERLAPRNSPFVIHQIYGTDPEEERIPILARNATPDDPFVAETHYNNGTWHVRYAFHGPGKPYWPPGADQTDDSQLVYPNAVFPDAVCRLRAYKAKDAMFSEVPLHSEAPHNFQQLLRCFSWWQDKRNKNKKPVLHIQRWGNREGTTEGMETIIAYYKAMEEVFGVRLDVEEYKGVTHTPHVIVDAPWRKMSTQHNSYLVTHPEHAKTLVNGMLDYYTPNNPNRAGCVSPKGERRTKPVIAFVDRQDARRTVKNQLELRAKLKEGGFTDVFYKPSFAGMSLVEQIKFMSEVDILIGPHGAQFTTSLYLPECAGLFEWFPPMYYSPNWFGSMLAMRGGSHFFLYGGGEVALNKARKRKKYVVSADAVLQVMPEIVERWSTCCANKQLQQQQ